MTSKYSVICLVGPSGAGKTLIAEKLSEKIKTTKIRTATTRTRRPGEAEDAYFFLTKEEFASNVESGSFLETSCYAKEMYGTPKHSVDTVISSAGVAVVPIDINGAMAYKEFYGDEVAVIFIQRSKKKVIEGVIERDIPITEKSARIVQLDGEYTNIDKCDFCVINNGDIEKSVDDVVNIIRK